MVKIFDDKDLQGILSNLHRWSSFDDLGSIKFDFNKICLVWQSQTASGQSQKILIPSSALYLTLKSSMCVTFVISQKNFWFFHILNSFEHQSQSFFTFRNYSKQESMSQRGILEIVDNAFNHHATEQITSEIHLLWEIPINFCYLVCVRQRVLHLLGWKKLSSHRHHQTTAHPSERNFWCLWHRISWTFFSFESIKNWCWWGLQDMREFSEFSL